MKSFALWFCLGLAAALAGCENSRHGLRIGDSVPSVTLEDVRGKPLALPDDVKGKVALLRFWSIECPLCSKELLKTFESIYQKYQSRGFIVLGINVGHPDARNEDFAKLQGLSYPMLVDPNFKVARRFGVAGLPTTFILDRRGVLREKIVGETGLDTLEQLFTNVLNEGEKP